MRRSVWLWLLILVSPWLRAHDALPIAITLTQLGAQSYQLQTLLPPTIPVGGEPHLALAPNCQRQGGAGAVENWQCAGDVPPAQLTLAYPGQSNNSPIIVRLNYRQGASRTVAAIAGSRTVQLPAQVGGWQVFTNYVAIGLQHIVGGYDHLLFLVCLMVIAGRWRRIVATVTGFTLGHALTISLATLGYLVLDSRTVEVLIALSIVFVAAEIVRPRRDSLTFRYPWLVASLFGLLHGLGFAGALREVGIPASETGLALLAFNLGIEFGQLSIVLALLLIFEWLMRRLPSLGVPHLSPRALQHLLAWPVGIIASDWFFGRLFAF
ncbi:HupE/UreJ family protein [Halioxenophilus sp. WMMB6]|uniref:HupE/UreJ family protein n=1 Tax=Halioxenophilus sp. WMMB6 TaxID=3073815 RepID=UPI00295EC3DF|nr:HupE/UreJ family protein [Halioxenophilus sp. WMMB6]